jgi:hypothetical protein
MDEQKTKVKLADALRAEAAALEAQATAKRAQADAIVVEPRADELLDAKQTLDRYGIGRDAIRGAAFRGELQVHRGARGKFLVRKDAIESWIEARPYTPTPRRAPCADLAEWDRETSAAMRALPRARVGSARG